MKYIRYEHRGKRVTLYPLVCWHRGAAQSDTNFIKEHVARIAEDPEGRWIYLGDGGECVTKQSKGEVFHQLASPQQQIEEFYELTAPIRDKGLFGIAGNHDRRIVKETGLDWTAALCTKLGIPYMGNAAFLDLQVVAGTKGTTQTTYHVFCHHGVDSSSVLGGKVQAAKKLEQLVEADAIISAHSHIALEVPPTYVARLTTRGNVEYREVRSFICGCAYDSRVPGYAEEKGYSPILPAHVGITFYGSTNHHKRPNEERRIEAQIWRAHP